MTEQYLMNKLSGSNRGGRWKKYLIFEEKVFIKQLKIRLISEGKFFLEEVFSSTSEIASKKFTAL